MEKEYKTSDARRRANAKYDAKTYKILSYKCKLTDLNAIQNYANSQNIDSTNNLLHCCVNYCIDNDIDLTAYKKQ